MISILLPSRGRPALLKRFLQSVADCCSGAIEVVVRLDSDDCDNYASQSEMGIPVKVRIHYIVGDAGKGMGAMTNECLDASCGNIIMLAGDDCVIRTKGFDSLVESLMPPDGIAMIYGDDTFQGANLATHPFLGRAVVEAWGGQVCPPEYHAEYIDTHIMDTFRHLAGLGYGRVLYVPALITEHMHHLNGKAPMDATYAKPMSLRESSMVYEALAERREYAAMAMKLRIEEAA